MLTLAPQARIWLHVPPVDLRKSFDGLCGLVRSVFGADPRDGGVFLFLNRRRDRIKMLLWDRDGLLLVYKRLEAGTFETIPSPDGAAVEIDAVQLAMLLGGVSLASAKRRPRYPVVGVRG